MSPSESAAVQEIDSMPMDSLPLSQEQLGSVVSADLTDASPGNEFPSLLGMPERRQRVQAKGWGQLFSSSSTASTNRKEASNSRQTAAHPTEEALIVRSVLTSQELAYFSGDTESLVVDVKHAVHAQTGIPVPGQKMLLGAEVLDNSAKLKDAGVTLPGEVLLLAQDPFLELLPALEVHDADVRSQTAEMLGSLHGNPDAVAALAMILNDESAQVRHAAIKALGSLVEVAGSCVAAEKTIVAAITGEILQTPDLHAADLLGYPVLEPRVAKGKGKGKAVFMQRPSAAPGTRCGFVPRLLHPQDVRVAIMLLIPFAKDITAVVHALSAQLKNRDQGIRVAAAAGLGCLGANGKHDASLALARSLRAGYSDARIAAAVELGNLGARAPAEAIPALEALLRHAESARMWPTAARSLQRLAEAGESRAVAALVSVSSDQKLPKTERSIAASALHELGDAARMAAMALEEVVGAQDSFGCQGTPIGA